MTLSMLTHFTDITDRRFRRERKDGRLHFSCTVFVKQNHPLHSGNHALSKWHNK